MILKLPLPKGKITQIESFIQDALEKVDCVPGLGLAIVQGEEVVYLNGFGYRDVENELPVTGETGFYLASKTKSFTGMATASLEAKNLIDLEASLSSFFPEWELSPPLDAQKINLIKLLSHNHSINNGGLQYRQAFIDHLPLDDQVRILFDFSRPGDGGFTYSNLGYNITGSILEKYLGQSWQKILKKEIFDPCGMEQTTTSMSKAIKGNFAFPYFKEKGQFKKLKNKTDQLMHPAGGIVSNPSDLARWILVNMNDGQIEGKQVLPQKVTQRVHRAYVDLSKDYFKFHRSAYELGWYQSEYEGDTLIHHFGSNEGYMAHVSYMPEHQIGVVALSNELEYGAQFPHLVATYIYDLLLAKKDLDAKYVLALKELVERRETTEERTSQLLQGKKEMLVRAVTNPDNWRINKDDFPGTYYNPRLGHFSVKEKKDGLLWADFGIHSAPLLLLATDQFLVDWQQTGYVSPPVQLQVTYDKSNKVAALNWDGREFRLLPKTSTPENLNTIHSKIRKELSDARRLQESKKETSVRHVLEKYYPSGALTEPYMDMLAYRYFNSNEKTIAIAILQYIVDRYPDSQDAKTRLEEVKNS